MTAPSSTNSALPERRVLIAFLLFVLVTGGASVAIRITYKELAPFWVAASRFLLAALVFWVVAIFKRIPLPHGRALLGAVLFGTLTVGLAFALIGWGLVATPASRYQILMATIPLLTLFLSSLQGVEAISRHGIFGSALAIGGIIFSVGGSSTSSLSIPRVAAILIAALLIAEGGVLIKKFPPLPPVMTNAVGMTVGGFILAIVSLLNGEKWSLPSQMGTWAAYLYLIFIVTVITFLLYLFVLNNWSASGVSYGFVLVPLVTIVLASFLVGEVITPRFLVGAGLVLAGVFVGALLPSPKKPAGAGVCMDSSGQVLPRCG